MRIDVDGAGNAWIVNSTGAICRWTGSSWQKLPGQARDIGVGANGTAWIIGWDAVKGGYSIQCWTANSWQRVNGGAIGISVGPDGKVWIVNNELQICRGNPFQSQPYSGIDGTWQSNWGPVTISTRADPVDPNAWIVTGGWQQGSNQHGVFNGTYRGGILTFRYYQPWNKKWGNAWFSVMEDKRSMKGWYQHDGSRAGMPGTSGGDWHEAKPVFACRRVGSATLAPAFSFLPSRNTITGPMQKHLSAGPGKPVLHLEAANIHYLPRVPQLRSRQ